MKTRIGRVYLSMLHQKLGFIANKCKLIARRITVWAKSRFRLAITVRTIFKISVGLHEYCDGVTSGSGNKAVVFRFGMQKLVFTSKNLPPLIM